MIEALSTYDPVVFDRLSDGNDMRNVVKKHETDLVELGKVICSHNLETKVGVYLAHRHLNLSADERLVWKLEDEIWNAQPDHVTDQQVFPINWKISVALNGDVVWCPIEFMPYTSKYQPEISIVTEIAENQAFLSDLKEKIVQLEVQDVFGLSIHQCRPEFNKDGMIVFEQSDIANRKTWARLVPAEEGLRKSDAITLWHFTKTGRVDVITACAYGNSRCCCGD